MGDTFAWGLVWGLVAGQLMTFGLIFLFMSHPRDDSFEEEDFEEKEAAEHRRVEEQMFNDFYEYLTRHDSLGEEENGQ